MSAEPRPPLQRVRIEQSHTVDDYAAVAHLAPAVAELHLEAKGIVPRLAGRTIWMVSSTARAEASPRCCRPSSRCSEVWASGSNGW